MIFLLFIKHKIKPQPSREPIFLTFNEFEGMMHISNTQFYELFLLLLKHKLFNVKKTSSVWRYNLHILSKSQTNKFFEILSFIMNKRNSINRFIDWDFFIFMIFLIIFNIFIFWKIICS